MINSYINKLRVVSYRFSVFRNDLYKNIAE